MDGDHIEIKSISYQNPDFAEAAHIRRTVFVDEQNAPEENEIDSYDPVARYLLLVYDGKAVGTLRFFDLAGWLKVGRVAILKEWRGLGLGKLLVARCLEEAKQLGFSKSVIHAQSDKRDFYAKFGYRSVGGEFIEDNIPHYRMEADL